MESFSTVVESDGSIQIPAEFCARRGWSDGAELLLVVRDDRVLVVPREGVDSAEEVHQLRGPEQSKQQDGERRE
jgi:bifunctional DNA-binding transcriptional regulator/antitoxin component of YhaV-PrlF toxin-antitoxin module